MSENYSNDFRLALVDLAISHFRDRLFPCKNCGHPVISGRICTGCQDSCPGQPRGQASPEFRLDSPVPPARDPEWVYTLSMREIAKEKPHLVKPLRLEQYVEPEGGWANP